jgi:hypothetical protein
VQARSAILLVAPALRPDLPMNRSADLANEPAAQPARDDDALRDYQELWFALAKRQWTSVVLVPADPGASAALVGKSLADIGTRLSEFPVTAISVSSVGYDSAFALADLQQHIERERRAAAERRPVVNVTPGAGADAEDAVEVDGAPAADALAPLPTARLVIAIPAVVSEPLGLAATQLADAIVLTVEIGRTKIADAQRTIDLIGRERIAGCFLVK